LSEQPARKIAMARHRDARVSFERRREHLARTLAVTSRIAFE
jgi:hypothetical protein